MPYPYTTSKQGLVGAINQLRSVFPSVVNADTLKKWSIAPNNEGSILNALRFIGIIDEEGKKNSEASKVFNEHDDTAFAAKFKKLVETSYAGLFENWGDTAWTLDKEKLITFFRNVDGSSARVGQEQAVTFLLLASFAGYGKPISESKASVSLKKIPSNKKGNGGTAKSSIRQEASPPESSHQAQDSQQNKTSGPALSVRIEINLPIADNQEVYDRIFKSIKENLYS